MDRYALIAAEAILWERHLLLIWQGLEADCMAVGETETLADMIRTLWSEAPRSREEAAGVTRNPSSSTPV